MKGKSFSNKKKVKTQTVMIQTKISSGVPHKGILIGMTRPPAINWSINFFSATTKQNWRPSGISNELDYITGSA